jgi:hypothetical protein
MFCIRCLNSCVIGECRSVFDSVQREEKQLIADAARRRSELAKTSLTSSEEWLMGMTDITMSTSHSEVKHAQGEIGNYESL